MNELGIYIHIPFCIRKCGYCDFLSAPPGKGEQAAYVNALCREITQWQEYGLRPVDTVFFGGGTPSLLSGSEITAIMTALGRHFHITKEAEITLEINPGGLEKELLQLYRSLGINRLSIGLQSTDDRLLQSLGRIHTREAFLLTWDAVRAAGFDNVNVDLMSGLPDQTLPDYMDSLEQILRLGTEHISAYGLMVEEGTPFYESYGPEGREKERLPEEEEERNMYHQGGMRMREAGYEHYEISNYAKPGYACRHNIKYWKRHPYLGLGLGASSMIEERRWRNTCDLTSYLRMEGRGEELREEDHRLTVKEAMEEFMFLGLRMREGISPLIFGQCFGVSYDSVYGTVTEKLIRQGLLERSPEGGRITLTERGIDVSNRVLADFLMPEE